MNCPKCDVTLGVNSTPDGSPQYVCVKCGWVSESVDTMVAASPAYRLARLKASGAAPGWYGPDGAKCDLWNDPISDKLLISWRCGNFSEDEARMCGFVEVPHA